MLKITVLVLKILSNLTSAPAKAPLDVSLQVTSSKNVLLSWRPPTLFQVNGDLIHYQLELNETQILHFDNGTTVMIEGTNRNIRVNTSVQIISGLPVHPNYRYTARIAAETTIGTGTFSSPQTVTALEDGELYLYLIIVVFACQAIHFCHQLIHFAQ